MMNILRNLPWRDAAFFIIGSGIACAVSTYIHENAHAVGYRALIANANPTIVQGFWTSICHSNIPQGQPPIFTSLGESIGSKNVAALIGALGPLVQSICLLGASLFLPKSLKSILLVPSLIVSNYVSTPLIGCEASQEGDYCKIVKNWGLSGYLGVAASVLSLSTYITHRIFKPVGRIEKIAIIAIPLMLRLTALMHNATNSLILKRLYTNAYPEGTIAVPPFEEHFYKGPPSLSALGQFFGARAARLLSESGGLLGVQLMTHGLLALRTRSLLPLLINPLFFYYTPALIDFFTCESSGTKACYINKQNGWIPSSALVLLTAATVSRVIYFLYNSYKKEKVG